MAIPDLEAATLAAVAQLAPEAYGVSIRARAGELLGGRAPSIGAVHLALRRIEGRGWVRARSGEPTPVRGGRAKRLFTLTASGAKALERASREAETRAKAFTRALRPA
jgi:DNA-binding PadR family transcriptional regulator